MDITTALTNPITYLWLIILAISTTIYAYGFVRRLRRRRANHGQTAFLVIVGNSIVAGFYFIILATAIGYTAALPNLAVLLICNIVAGLPMIVEYIDDHTNAANTADRLHTLIEED